MGLPSRTPDAYAVVASNCLSSQSLAHELGHLQGLDHNRENKANSNKYALLLRLSRVYPTDGFRDIMSYACSTIAVPRVLQFSTRTSYYSGYATGVSYEASPTTAAETARTLNDTATTVAGYMASSTSTATAPSQPVWPGVLRRRLQQRRPVLG